MKVTISIEVDDEERGVSYETYNSLNFPYDPEGLPMCLQAESVLTAAQEKTTDLFTSWRADIEKFRAEEGKGKEESPLDALASMFAGSLFASTLSGLVSPDEHRRRQWREGGLAEALRQAKREQDERNERRRKAAEAIRSAEARAQGHEFASEEAVPTPETETPAWVTGADFSVTESGHDSDES